MSNPLDMAFREGTPKDLCEAIDQAICVGPFKDMDQRIRLAIRECLAQKFQTALLNAKSEGEQEIIMALWVEIIAGVE